MYNRISGKYQVSVEQSNGTATDIIWKRKFDPVREEKERGCILSVQAIRIQGKSSYGIFTTPSEKWNPPSGA
jgi:hypothetical protein